ncbi:hypothetical protein Salpa_1222 [Sporomusa sp. KB1]|jgi:hypothetical protein|nr:hypothetical protein Salpa_1222 [Sporomusa sp. KB1]
MWYNKYLFNITNIYYYKYRENINIFDLYACKPKRIDKSTS